MASTGPARAFQADPYDYGEVRRLAAELELAEPVAVTLVRRGYRTVDAARRFLEARESHEPSEFRDMEEVCDQILSVARGTGRITIHGDYDVDGVTSTAILVSTLRSLGAECDWFIPDRLADGYGLTMSSVEELRRRGTELVITVDCGIGSIEEVAAARAAGIQVVVTDHHLPGEQLPDCPIIHPVVSGYPFEGLCAAGVAHKLATALCDAAGRGAVETVSGTTTSDRLQSRSRRPRNSRRHGSAGRREPPPGARGPPSLARKPARRTARPDGGRVRGSRDSRCRRPRLPPRPSDQRCRTPLPGRCRGRADAHRRPRSSRRDRSRARQRQRRAPLGRAEGGGGRPARPLGAAGRAEGRPGARPRRRGVAPGRRRHRRLSHGRAPLPARRSCSRSTAAGPRARPGAFPASTWSPHSTQPRTTSIATAATAPPPGSSWMPTEIDAFREAFIEHAASEIDPADLIRRDRLDALVGVGREGIGMDLARQLESLGPFGMGNPGPRLLVPSGRLREVRPLGEEGKHSRFQLESGAGRAAGVAFGMNGEISRREDQAARSLGRARGRSLERRRAAARGRARALSARRRRRRAGRRPCGEGCPAPDGEWWDRLEHEARARRRRPARRAARRPCPGRLPA